VQQRAGVSIDDGAVSGPSRILINLAADIRGLLLAQEAVAWHFPIYNGGKFGQNGAEYTIGRALTEAETESLYQSLQKELGHADAPPIPTETGFRVLNFPDEKFALQSETDPAKVRELQAALRKKNTEFHAALTRAVSAQPFHGEVAKAERFETDGELRSNDWSQGDADYRSRIEAASRGLGGQDQGGGAQLADLQKWIDDDLRPRVEAVNRRFAEKYGWDQAEGEVALASRPPVAATPTHVEVGGGTYTTAPIEGVDRATQQIIFDVMAAEESNIADERGNAGEPITWEETGEQSQALLESSFGRTFNSLVRRLPRSTANAQLLESFAKIVNAAGKNVQAAVERYNLTSSAQDLAHLNAAREQLGVVLAPFMGYRTEAGRALNILRKVQSDFSDAQAIFDALGDGNENAMKDFARRVKGAGSVADVLELTRASYKPTALDQFREYWINGLLSGPWTHVVNMTSNTAFQMLDAATEVGVSLVSKNVSTRAALARFSGMMAGVQVGLTNAKKAFLTEEPQLDQRTQMDQGKGRAIAGKKGKVIRIPSRLLMAEDEFAKAVNFTGELYRMAMERAIERSPDDPHAVFQQVLTELSTNRKARAQAQGHADRMTFQSPLGKLGQGVMNLREQTKVGWMIAPFIRTPTNILKRAMEYTPTALAMPSVRETLAAGGRDAAIARGRMLVGSALMFGVVNLVLQGLLTGAGPDDPAERELWMRLGKKPYSVKVGDEWVRYNRFEPIGMLIGVAADMAEMSQTAAAGQAEKIGTMLLASVMLNLADKTYLRGITDFVQASLEPKRYLSQWASGMVGAAIPNISAQAARAHDPLVRDARGIVDTLKGRVPGLRQSLPAKLDVAGQPIDRAIFEPAASTPERDDPLAEAMLSLGVFKRGPGRTITLQGRTRELSGDEYQSLKAAMQQTRWEKLTPYVQGAEFQRLVAADPAHAQQALGTAYEKVGDVAKRLWLRDHEDVLEQLRATPVKRRPPSNYASE
jgi:hypothetical protein